MIWLLIGLVVFIIIKRSRQESKKSTEFPISPPTLKSPHRDITPRQARWRLRRQKPRR